MEQLYANNFFTAFKTDDGILIEEQKKGTLKMIIVLIGVSILAALGGFILVFLGGKMGMIIAPFLIWGGILILGATLIELLIKLW